MSSAKDSVKTLDVSKYKGFCCCRATIVDLVLL